MTVFTKITLKKIRKINFLDDFCGYLGPCYYVSIRKRGTRCIAPKLRGEICLQSFFKVIFVNTVISEIYTTNMTIFLDKNISRDDTL